MASPLLGPATQQFCSFRTNATTCSSVDAKSTATDVMQLHVSDGRAMLEWLGRHASSAAVVDGSLRESLPGGTLPLERGLVMDLGAA